MTSNHVVMVRGVVIRGFGRGSKELGIPTANFPEDVVAACSGTLSTGIYYGWAKVDDGPVYKMVMCVGWNPFYHNEKKSMETHIIHKFDNDFYGSDLRVAVLGYIRPEKNFTSVDELISEIRNDISIAESKLEDEGLDQYRHNSFFSD